MGGLWYYVEVEENDILAYPIWRPDCLFEIVDSTVPEHWESRSFTDYHDQEQVILSFPEWATDPYFYERLVDGDEEAIATYQTERTKLIPPEPPIVEDDDYWYKWGLASDSD